MLRLISSLVFGVLTVNTYAQIQSVDVTGGGNGIGGANVKINNALGQTPSSAVNYDEVRGRYFWDENWKPARLLMRNGGLVNLTRVKLNLFTNEIHYIGDTGSELVAQKGLVKELVFATSLIDTTVTGRFKSLSGLTRDFKENYFQVLNRGSYELLKLTSITLYKGDYDAMLGRRDFKFVSAVRYYLANGDNRILELKSLNREALFSIIERTEQSEEYLKKNKNKLKNESDVVEFLVWLNSEAKK
ncbi:MAG: hypothetical protein HOP30_07860 [Cyclobacteriaceae bacterium]|nr:hypothetical protein [Cyclobacteriaceae bacterium]